MNFVDATLVMLAAKQCRVDSGLVSGFLTLDNMISADGHVFSIQVLSQDV